ncbi:MAG: GTPase domain-containing protein [Candidatus Aenigmatarchaeota archaeon]
MIFPESFPTLYSLILITTISIPIFFWRFLVFKKNLLKEFKLSPSIVVAGVKECGKSSFLKFFTKAEPVSSLVHDGLKVATLNLKNQEFQLVELPYFVDGLAKDLMIFKDMNLVYGIYIFDVSRDSPPIEVQLDHFNKLKNFFKSLNFILIANKMDEVDGEKLKKLEEELGSVFKISLKETPETSKLLKEEFEDIQKIISKLMEETKVEARKT